MHGPLNVKVYAMDHPYFLITRAPLPTITSVKREHTVAGFWGGGGRGANMYT